jgi:hypothetical protein
MSSGSNNHSSFGTTNTSEPLFIPSPPEKSSRNSPPSPPPRSPQPLLQDLPSNDTQTHLEPAYHPDSYLRPGIGLAALRNFSRRGHGPALVPVVSSPEEAIRHQATPHTLPQIQGLTNMPSHNMAPPPVSVFAGIVGKPAYLERVVLIHSFPQVRELLDVLQALPGRILRRTLNSDPKSLRVAQSNEPQEMLTDSLWSSALTGFEELGLLSDSWMVQMSPSVRNAQIDDQMVRLGIPPDRELYVLYIYPEACVSLHPHCFI